MGRKHPFFLCPNFQPKCYLIHRSNMNEKGYDGDPWPLVVLRMPLSSFYFQSKFWFEQRHGLSVVHIAHLPGTHVSLAGTSMHHGCSWILCSWDIMNVICKLGFKDHQWICILHVYLLCLHACSLHCPIGLYLQNTSSKIKLLRISR